MGICYKIYSLPIINKSNYPARVGAVLHILIFMAQLTSDMAAALKAYGISKGCNLPDQFYNDMSWTGLTHIQNTNGQKVINPVFVSLVPSNTVRQRIINTIKVEESRNPLNGIQPSGNINSCNR